PGGAPGLDAGGGVGRCPRARHAARERQAPHVRREVRELDEELLRDAVLAVPRERLRPDDVLGEVVNRVLDLLLAAREAEFDRHGIFLTDQTKTFCDSAPGNTSAGSIGRPSSMQAAS